MKDELIHIVNVYIELEKKKKNQMVTLPYSNGLKDLLYLSSLFKEKKVD